VSIHQDPSPLAGKTVRIKSHVKNRQSPDFGGSLFRVEDWHDRVAGESWQVCEGNPACLVYSLRFYDNPLPMDDEVLYGKVGAFGHLVHVTEIEPVEDAAA